MKDLCFQTYQNAIRSGNFNDYWEGISNTPEVLTHVLDGMIDRIREGQIAISHKTFKVYFSPLVYVIKTCFEGKYHYRDKTLTVVDGDNLTIESEEYFWTIGEYVPYGDLIKAFRLLCRPSNNELNDILNTIELLVSQSNLDELGRLLDTNQTFRYHTHPIVKFVVGVYQGKQSDARLVVDLQLYGLMRVTEVPAQLPPNEEDSDELYLFKLNDHCTLVVTSRPFGTRDFLWYIDAHRLTPGRNNCWETKKLAVLSYDSLDDISNVKPVIDFIRNNIQTKENPND